MCSLKSNYPTCFLQAFLKDLLLSGWWYYKTRQQITKKIQHNIKSFKKIIVKYVCVCVQTYSSVKKTTTHTSVKKYSFHNVHSNDYFNTENSFEMAGFVLKI